MDGIEDNTDDYDENDTNGIDHPAEIPSSLCSTSTNQADDENLQNSDDDEEDYGEVFNPKLISTPHSRSNHKQLQQGWFLLLLTHRTKKKERQGQNS